MGKQYPITWRDMQLPTGQDFAVAMCGYNNKVRHMTFGNDPIRRMLIQNTEFDDQGCCLSGKHCLALDCPYNTTEPEHLIHMLDMTEDEEVDEITAKTWGAKTMTGCFVAMAKKVSDDLNAENQAKSE